MPAHLEPQHWTAEEQAQYQTSGYRHNFVCNVLDGSFYQFGNAIMQTSVMLPALLVLLGASDAQILLIPTIPIIVGRLPQLFTAYWAERLTYKLPALKVTGIFQRLPWLCMGIALWLWGATHKAWVVNVILGGVTVATLGYAVTAPAWGEFIARVIPARVRGRFMGINVALGNGLGLLAPLIVAGVFSLHNLSTERQNAVLFFIMTGLICVSYFSIIQTREPRLAPLETHTDPVAYFRELPSLLRTDPSLRWFLVASALSYAQVIGAGLFMVYGTRVLGVTINDQPIFLFVVQLTTLTAGVVLGFLTDRAGHKIGLLVGLLSYAAAALLAVFAPTRVWLFPVFMLLAVYNSSQYISLNNLIFDMAPPARRPTYLALTSTLPAPFALVFTLLCLWLKGSGPSSYPPAFAASALLVAASALALWLGVKVRKKETLA
jgi:MFS family permease